MLKKKQRMTKSQFDHYFKSGRKIHGEYLDIIYTESKCFHGAVVVGKKVFKKALLRNKLRRRIYSILYNLHKTHGFFGVYIILSKPTTSRAGFKEVQAEVRSLLAKSGVTQLE
ncbi:hypothetical protein CL653_00740 [bacterium]|nr:hypothetical protein [bacterium]